MSGEGRSRDDTGEVTAGRTVPGRTPSGLRAGSRRSLVVAVLVAVVLLAGCSGLAGSDDGTSGGPGAATPTPGPDAGGDGDGPAGATVEYPDGWSAEGVTDVQVALDQHDRRLDGESYVVNHTTRRLRDGTYDRFRLAVDAEAGRLRATRVEGGEVVGQQYFADGTLYRRYRTPEGEVRYRTRPVEGGLEAAIEEVRWRVPVRVLLSSAEFRTAAATDGGETATVRYEIPGWRTEEYRERFGTVNGSLVIGTDGRIRRIEYVQTTAEKRERVTRTYSTVDGASVERPTWLSEARNATAN